MIHVASLSSVWRYTSSLLEKAKDLSHQPRKPQVGFPILILTLQRDELLIVRSRWLTWEVMISPNTMWTVSLSSVSCETWKGKKYASSALVDDKPRDPCDSYKRFFPPPMFNALRLHRTVLDKQNLRQKSVVNTQQEQVWPEGRWTMSTWSCHRV